MVRLGRAGQGWVNIEPVPSGRDEGQQLTALMTLIGRGDQQAFARLYDLTSHRVLGLVVRILRDRVISEEVAQEVFFEIWREASRFDAKRGSALSWIMTITHRRAVDRVRAEERHSRHHPVPSPAEFDVVFETVEASLDQRLVRKALSSLSPIQLEVITMAYYAGYTYQQVAEHLDMPLGTIKTRMRDGLLRLRAALEGMQ